MKRVKVFISGKVQGVFFRDNTRKKAKELGLRGYVKNLKDGRVEAVFEGEEEKIKEVLEFCKKGSIISKVSKVEVIEEEYKNEFKDFEVGF